MNWSKETPSDEKIEGKTDRADAIEDDEATVTDDDSAADIDSDDDEEDPGDYKKGGYHPVKTGDVFKQRYKVLKKLGWGHFSTVWLVHDSIEDRFAALKIVKSAPHYTEAAEDEVKLLRAVREHDPKSKAPGHIVLLYDDFKHYGPHGCHICMVMNVLGKNLLHMIKVNKYKGVKMCIVQRIIRQTLQGLESLHNKCKIIHTDIKPENVLFSLSPEEDQALAMKARKILDRPLKNGKNGGSSNSSSTSGDKKLTKTQKKNQKRRNKKKAEAAEVPKESLKTAIESETNDESGGNPSRNRSGTTYDLRGKGTISPSSTIPGLTEIDEDAPTADEATQRAPVLKPRDLPVEVQIAQRLVPDVKIADLGNSCWVHKHFSPDIQTRQYRSLEVILGADYDQSADIWSVACMAFELATGDYLFEPHTGKDYSRDEDHCALISELLGSIPTKVALSGEYSMDIFTRRGEFRHIHELKPWSLKNVLQEKYKFHADVASEFADFLLPMLHVDKSKRASASDCLKHAWLAPSEEELKAERVITAHRDDVSA